MSTEMVFEWIILGSDAFFLAILTAFIFFLMRLVRAPHLLASVRRLFKKRRNVVAGVIFALYAGVAMLDSVHFIPHQVMEDGSRRASSEVLSALDRLMWPLGRQLEKTYSAPFAAYSLAKEWEETADGRQYVNPRLQYGGRHLQSPELERGMDILVRGTTAFLGALASAVFVVVAFWGVWWMRYRAKFDHPIRDFFVTQNALPYRVAAFTLGIVILFMTPLFALSHYYHVLGTEKVGQDVFYIAIKSIRTGLLIGSLTTLVVLPFGILLGMMAGYFKRGVDDIIQFLYTTLSSIPGVLLIAAATLSMQVVISRHSEWFATTAERADLRLLSLCFILGLTSWTSLCRLIRGQTLTLVDKDYVKASRALGASNRWILVRHILPNVFHIVLITVALDFSGLVLAEAVLSYVGVGVDPTTYSWGNMINAARLEMARDPVVWWSLGASFVFMLGLVLCANIFADGLRDAFDPRTTG